MREVLIIAATSTVAKLWWVCVAAVASVLVYRAAFPPDRDQATVNQRLPEQIVDPRPRMRCPQCEEMVLVEARLCRFCGHRFAEGLGSANPYPQ